MRLCLDPTLEVRHGAIVAVAEMLPALASSGIALAPERQHAVADIIDAVDAARLYRGKGGELMRESVCMLIARISKVKMPLQEAHHTKVLETIDDNLKHPLQSIQMAAVAALFGYTRAYVTSDVLVSEAPGQILEFKRFIFTIQHPC